MIAFEPLAEQQVSSVTRLGRQAFIASESG